ncbi:hypothetical protein [Streptomyces sp. NPDC001478]
MTIDKYAMSREGSGRAPHPGTPAVTEAGGAFQGCPCARCRAARAEAAYRAWLAHTTSCATCRAGAACVTAVGLGRAWRNRR